MGTGPLLALLLSTSSSGLVQEVEAHARGQWQNFTVYRVTPVQDRGVVNMNTADAAGDVYFGLSQLLLPYMCTSGDTHMSLWCNNRKWLSGGTAWMVYRKFTIEAKQPFGEYSPCNPDPVTGVFSCGHYGGGGSNNWPKVCNPYHEHHSHYVVGDPLGPPIALPTNGSLGQCCEECTNRGPSCEGWVALNRTGGVCNANCTACQPLHHVQLLNNPDGVISGQKEGGGPDERCWYQGGSQTNATWAPYCSTTNCTCDAIDKLSLGIESHAMCWNHGGGNNSHPRPGNSSTLDYDGWMSSLACLMDGNWFSTQAPGECKQKTVPADGDEPEECWWRLISPEDGDAVANATCVDDRVQAALRTKNPSCW